MWNAKTNDLQEISKLRGALFEIKIAVALQYIRSQVSINYDGRVHSFAAETVKSINP